MVHDITIINKYINGELSEDEEIEVDTRCIQDKIFFEEMQAALKKKLTESFNEKYADIGKRVLNNLKISKFHIKLSMIPESIQTIKDKTKAILNCFANGLINSPAVPVVAQIRGSKHIDSSDIVTLLESGDEIVFKIESNQTKISIKFDEKSNNIIINPEDNLPNQFSKLLLIGTKSEKIINVIYRSSVSNVFEIPLDSLANDVIIQIAQ